MAETVQYGYCTNKASCSLASNHEKVFVPLDGKCPECGQIIKVDSMASQPLKFIPLVVILAALGAGGYYAKKNFLDPKGGDANHPTSTPAVDTPKPGTDAAAEKDNPVAGGAVDKPTFGLENDANAKARRDVLARIDLMPHLTDQQKAKLTTSVDRARGMGCIFVIPFENGKKALGPREEDILAKGFQSASIQKLMEDPTLVFVVLGYADKKADPQSEKTSIDRAQSVLNTMKDRCNVQNVMYSVGMGASTLADAKQIAKNRLVEVWAVYP